MNTQTPSQLELPLYNTRNDLKEIAKDLIIRLKADSSAYKHQTELWLSLVWRSLRIPQWRENRMAKRRNKGLNVPWRFVNTILSPQERKEFETWLADNLDDVINYMSLIMEEGYKISARYDNENETWLATITSTDQSALNPKSSLTSRHHSFEDAMCLCVYKHNYLSDSGEWRDDRAAGDWG